MEEWDNGRMTGKEKMKEEMTKMATTIDGLQKKNKEMQQFVDEAPNLKKQIRNIKKISRKMLICH